MKRILILHGPNLNLLGRREPELYGSLTLEDLNRQIEQEANRLNLEIKIYQSNSEGELLDILHGHSSWADGIVLNPGALAHSSYALYDAIKGVGKPTVEVHLTHLFQREDFRTRSVTAPACVGLITGLGPQGYLLALRFLAGTP